LTVAPTLTNFAQTHTKWREGKALAVFAKTTKRAQVGTQLSFTLNESAAVSLAFTQSVTGRKSLARCVAQTTKNRKAKSCKLTLTLGTIKHSGHSGKNSVTFQGRVLSSKTLKPGHYTVTATAANAAGQQSRPSSLSFTIVKSARASAITPVPGDVGPMTIAMLLEQTVQAANQQNRY
jgi:predicted phage tail protein